MFTEVRACRICGNPRLEPLLQLGSQALTGVFPRDPGTTVPAGPLELVQCRADGADAACGLVQLRHSYAPAEMFGANYGYRSSLNGSMVRHLADIVARVTALVRPQPGDLVLDIGSNDSTTLGLYGRADLHLVGVDPCGAKFAHYYPPHIDLIRDFFSAEKVRERVGPRKRARVVTSIAMFYDLERPADFVRDVHDLLADDGVWVVEQSYLPTMLDQTAYDTICHEHLEYYALGQLKWMFDRVGLKIIDVRQNRVNGGSFQVTAARHAAPYPEATAAVARWLAEERERGLDGPRPYAAFRDRVLAHRDDLRETVEAIRRRGGLVFGYGASTKGNVVLQYCGLTTEHLPCIAEVNEDKFGCVTPGTAIPIVSEQIARARHPAAFLVLPWHFRDGVVQREAAYLAKGGTLLFPLPTIEAVRNVPLERAA